MSKTSAPSDHSFTILIIEDLPGNLAVVVGYLENQGFQVLVVESGERAMHLAEFGQPDLILLDVLMQGMGGFETCRRLKAAESTKEIPVIFMTALAETANKIAGFEAGGVDYITKPFEHAEVLARVRTHLTLRALRKQLEAQNAKLQQEVATRERFEVALRLAHKEPEAYRELDRVNDELRAMAELEAARAQLESEVVERRHAEAQLRESEVFNKLIIDSSRDCIKVLDLEARLMFMNPGGLRALEICDFEPLVGAQWLEFWNGDDKLAATCAFETAKAGEAGEFVGYFATTQTKTPKWWYVVVSPICNAIGRVTRILAVSRDVTEYKQMEFKLRQSIATRDEFLSIASHELKTPITSLQMQLEMARRKVDADAGLAPPPPKLARMLDTTLKQAERLTALVNKMLDVARIQTDRLMVSPERVDLSELTRDVFERFGEQLLDASCVVTLELARDVVGSWDQSRIEQVVENLASNALRYAPGGRIEVATRLVGDRARLVVRDHGCGIPLDKQAVIFERFERGGKPLSDAGLGLGLFIAREIVRSHNGFICCETPDGPGVRFVLELPLEPAHAVEGEQTST